MIELIGEWILEHSAYILTGYLIIVIILFLFVKGAGQRKCDVYMDEWHRPYIIHWED